MTIIKTFKSKSSARYVGLAGSGSLNKRRNLGGGGQFVLASPPAPNSGGTGPPVIYAHVNRLLAWTIATTVNIATGPAYRFQTVRPKESSKLYACCYLRVRNSTHSVVQLLFGKAVDCCIERENKREAQQMPRERNMRAVGCRRSAKLHTFPYPNFFSQFGITRYYDPGQLWHAGSHDTDLSVVCWFPPLLHCAITIHQPNRRTDGRTSC